jgi:hypothetical protein
MADIVFEHYAEGGITRFTALFYGQDPGKVGSVRSGRLIDIEIPAMYGAIFGYSGSSAGVKNRIRNSDLVPQYIAAPDFGVGAPTFYRVPEEGKAFEHTLFSDPQALRALAEERGINQRPDYKKYMVFSEEPPGGGEPIDYFEINYLANSWIAQWQYDAESGSWLRSMGGVKHTDALTGKQISAENVIIVYANHIQTDIQEDTWGGGHKSIEIQVWGTGPVLIFRDGLMVNGFWSRIDRHDMMTFSYGEGEPLPLKPGNHWVQFVPLETTSTLVFFIQYRSNHFRILVISSVSLYTSLDPHTFGMPLPLSPMAWLVWRCSSKRRKVRQAGEWQHRHIGSNHYLVK